MRTKKEVIDEIMAEYKEFCRQTEEDCIAEGYPGRGSNYELRVNQEWNDYYLPTLEAIEKEYAKEGL